MTQRHKAKSTVIAVGLCALFLFSSIGIVGLTEFFTPHPQGVTIVYDPNNSITMTTTQQLEQQITAFGPITMVAVSSAGELHSVIEHTSNPIVYVFHGDTNGWEVGNTFVPNNILANWIQAGSSKAVFFAVCDSTHVAQFLHNKYIGALGGVTDYRVAIVLTVQSMVLYYKQLSTKANPMVALPSSTVLIALQQQINAYIHQNAFMLLTLLLHPQQPLMIIGCTYCGGGGGGSGGGGTPVFTETSLATVSIGIDCGYETDIQSACNLIVGIQDALGHIPGFSMSFSLSAKEITGNAYDPNTGDSQDGIQFDYATIAVSASLYAPSLTGQTGSYLSGDSQSSSSGFSIKIGISDGIPSVTMSGSMSWTSAVFSWPTPPKDSDMRSITNNWISSNLHPDTYDATLAFTISDTWSVGIEACYDGNCYGPSISIGIGGSIDYKLDSSGNVVVTAGIAGTASAGFNAADIVSFNINAAGLPIVVQTTDSSSGETFTVVSGAYIGWSYSAFWGLASGSGAFTFPYVWYNTGSVSGSIVIDNNMCTNYGWC